MQCSQSKVVLSTTSTCTGVAASVIAGAGVSPRAARLIMRCLVTATPPAAAGMLEAATTGGAAPVSAESLPRSARAAATFAAAGCRSAALLPLLPMLLVDAGCTGVLTPLRVGRAVAGGCIVVAVAEGVVAEGYEFAFKLAGAE